ncbi:tRNA (N6-threonylcarbamoyladenosine(37)-N6)-methyltransferase TrmO [Ferrimonas sediminicola]|uniref:tRNA (N6-threonylcarbamoyladenosine(37)-N6)-methyltransferase TrmO n=1 Tax=Ferrimonas sediminicola TaxID=2569538 RepID=A0A4U1BEV3_9GAMM|nr:tRNA (N6-threonylcarbamoyladenosine(37)-N6)-methyltransferase TrmO [Ferrimonas sediminicola]TKB49764.1 tRNA (N6-threonylcarbamoyladenosine(37)-N6)-methyltransferase TrmO [Ferrimonas sediminicola]
MKIEIEPVALCRSPYKQKFAIPRQPRLVPAAIGRLELQGEYNNPDLYRGLEQFDTLWLIFAFHENLAQGWKPTVRPPRLGGNTRMGVFATRATFRPNGLGLSAVKLRGVGCDKGQHYIEVEGIDLLDGTPVYDIKPYIPYSDALPDAAGGFAQEPPPPMAMAISPEAQDAMAYAERLCPGFRALATQVLAQDPRPGYKKEEGERVYGVQLHQFDLRWQVKEGRNLVVDVVSLETT